MVSKSKTKLKIAVVAGLARELKFLEKFKDIRVFQGYSKKAMTAARTALSEKPDVIISFGLAGSINPRVQNGKIIIPQNIIDNSLEIYSFYNQQTNKEDWGSNFNKNYANILKIINPVIPHFSNECLVRLKQSVENIKCQDTEPKYLEEEIINIVTQING